MVTHFFSSCSLSHTEHNISFPFTMNLWAWSLSQFGNLRIEMSLRYHFAERAIAFNSTSKESFAIDTLERIKQVTMLLVFPETIMEAMLHCELGLSQLVVTEMTDKF